MDILKKIEEEIKKIEDKDVVFYTPRKTTIKTRIKKIKNPHFLLHSIFYGFFSTRYKLYEDYIYSLIGFKKEEIAGMKFNTKEYILKELEEYINKLELDEKNYSLFIDRKKYLPIEERLEHITHKETNDTIVFLKKEEIKQIFEHYKRFVLFMLSCQLEIKKKDLVQAIKEMHKIVEKNYHSHPSIYMYFEKNRIGRMVSDPSIVKDVLDENKSWYQRTNQNFLSKIDDTTVLENCIYLLTDEQKKQKVKELEQKMTGSFESHLNIEKDKVRLERLKALKRKMRSIRSW